MTAAEFDSAINPALALRLGPMGVILPSAERLAEMPLPEILDEVRAAVADHPDWQVKDEVFLSYFAFHKESMYRDLIENEDLIAQHAAVRALAAGGRDGSSKDFTFVEMSDAEVDRQAPAEQIPLVLDADASQRASIAAALAERSFVLDGPPGTGKSQTIANMIGALLHAGKRVLFVSEKVAALEVVRNRLLKAGLDDYLLELHSHKVTRKEVAVTLGEALEATPRAVVGMADADLERARRRRVELSAYADAVNMLRSPLNRSLHDALGRISQLVDVPVAPKAQTVASELTVESFESIRAASSAMARAWRPVQEGRNFVWRGVVERGSVTSQLYAVTSTLSRIMAAVEANTEMARAFNIDRPGLAVYLAELLAAAGSLPAGMPQEWLTVDDLAVVDKAIGGLILDITALGQAEAVATEQAGAPWHSIPVVEIDYDCMVLTGSAPTLDPSTLTAKPPRNSLRHSNEMRRTFAPHRRPSGD